MMPDPGKKEEFERRQAPLMRALFKEICACAPRDWEMATLELDVETTAPGRAFTISHRLRNPASRRGASNLPQSLLVAAGRVHSICHEYHHLWVQGTFTVVFKSSDGLAPHRSLITVAHFEYPPPRASVKLGGNN